MNNTSLMPKKRFLFLLCIACISIILTPLASFAASPNFASPIDIKPGSLTQIAQSLTALALLSTFLERAIEIVSKILDNDKTKMSENWREKLIPVITLVIGIMISFTGIRGLEPFFTVPDNPQGNWFRGIDIILTGTVISGGTAGIHKILTSLTAFLDVTKASAEAEKDSTKVKAEAGKASASAEIAKAEAEKASASAETVKAEAEKAGHELEKFKHEEALKSLRNQ
jgi:hypothetical protein